MRTPIDEVKWRPILNALIQSLERFPNSREKLMARFYIEELYYRFWHHKLGPLCPCTDIDFVEYRPPIDSSGWVDWKNPKVEGIFEIKNPLTARVRPRSQIQEFVLTTIAQKLEVPFYLVSFTTNLKMFQLSRVDKQESLLTLSEQDYMNFMQSLGRQT